MYDDRIISAAKAERQLPKPTGHKILLALPAVKRQTEGGVYLPEQLIEREELAAICGYVLAMGPDCYVSTPEKTFPGGPYCKVGDWVLIRSYVGTRFSIKGQRFVIINDDLVEAVVADPREIVRR